MLNTIKIVFFKYSPWIIVIPLFLSIRNYRKDKSEALKPIILYLLLSICTQIISLWLWTNSINNLPVLHVYTVLEFYVLMWFYVIIFSHPKAKKIILTFTVLFTLFAIADSCFLENIFTFNTLSRSIEALLIIAMALIYFLRALSNESLTNNLNSRSVNYINTGIFIYFSGSIVLFTFSNYINILARPLVLNIWSIHTLLLILFYSIITISLIRHAK
jgi:hypothetical protein